ncbi:unnamed protein product [Lactuca virosa]|uniref:Acid phosphatase n=1 Tax=Lactuca virosa TaxID=75947 RepID=A0AAU9P796_9ASTR|nr:unnamed protein product [Lactuca virosa]
MILVKKKSTPPYIISTLGNAMETLMFFLLFVMSNMVLSTKLSNDHLSRHSGGGQLVELSSSYCLSWRLATETNNLHGWRTVPIQCLRHVEAYMIRGQYDSDMKLIVDEIRNYIDQLVLSDDGMDAWILDVDETCLSNLYYYEGKRFGGDPYDPHAFKEWALIGICPGIPAILGLFRNLVESGFKVFLISGRDETAFGLVTVQNLHLQGFFGFQRLILRSEAYKGQSGVVYKSEIRRKLVEEGYRIWGNVDKMIGLLIDGKQYSLEWSSLLEKAAVPTAFSIGNLPVPMDLITSEKS